MYVKIFTNQGIYGVGEGADATPGTYHLVKMMGQRIMGKSPLNVHRLFEDIRKSGFFAGAQSGMYVAVLSAVESALWDLAGKALGLPVYQLLGGKFRDKIRVYMDTALYQTKLPKPSDFAEAAQKAVDMGFNAIKFDIDQANDPNKYDAYNWTANPAELRRMYDQIAAARLLFGDDLGCGGGARLWRRDAHPRPRRHQGQRRQPDALLPLVHQPMATYFHERDRLARHDCCRRDGTLARSPAQRRRRRAHAQLCDAVHAGDHVALPHLHAARGLHE